MRKLSIGPLFILLVIFLVSRFASAAVQDMRGRELPTELPQKKSDSLPQKLPAKKASVRKSVATTLPAKAVSKTVVTTVSNGAASQTKTLPKKRAAKKTVVVVQNQPQRMPKKLPAFKAHRVQINFEEIPSTPLEQSVVIISPALEAPQDANAIAAASIEALPQALPVKPPQEVAATEVTTLERPTVERPIIEILPSEPTGELWQQDPNAVAAQPLTESDALATASSTSSGLSDIASIAEATAAASTLSTSAEAATPPTATANTEVATEVKTEVKADVKTEVQAEAAAKVEVSVEPATEAPAQIATSAEASAEATSSVSSAVSAGLAPEATVEAKATTAQVGPTSTVTTVTTTLEVSQPTETEGLNKLFVRAGYLSARYAELSPELKNGASTFGVSFARAFSSWEAKASLDFAYGLDQQVSVRNTRMSMARLEGAYLFGKLGFIRPLVGAGVGVANVDVTSYRESEDNGEVILREHAQGTAFLVAPHVGLRASFSKSILLDLTAQYLALAGGSDVSKLGGALLEASFGFAF